MKTIGMVLFWCAIGWAQSSKLYEISPTVPYAKFGWSVAGCGDVNKDGFGDFIIGAPYVPPTPGSYIQTGAAYVYSGKDGALLYEKMGNPLLPFGWFGYSVGGGGDIDADGTPDFIVGGSADMSVYSGLSGNLLYQIIQGDSSSEPNNSVTDLGDINGDGRADFAVGNPYLGATFEGNVKIFSGATGLPLYEINGHGPYERFGYSVAGTGDGNFVVGAPNSDGSFYLGGAVYLYRGSDGAALQAEYGRHAFAAIGWSVSSAGDVDKDGVADFMAGAPYDSAGACYVWSGKTGALLYAFYASIQKDFGYAVAGPGDVNGDSTPDFVVGERFASFNDGFTQPGAIYLFSGANGNLLWKVLGDSAEDRLGWAVGAAGDVNGDGRSDIIAGAPSACIWGQYPYSGAAAIYGMPAPVPVLCPKNLNITVLRPDSGAIVNYEARGNCTPPSGSFFPIGWNMVVCQGSDDFCWFNVHIHEKGKP